ncbi:MAG: bifunctional hydroxymethylpyrimidine kinase/phosphomethylpyrimidine kinase [Burkholderiaceae bacterium]
MQNKTSPLILTFGAADPTGAIGIQADIASFAAMGCLGVSAVTAILVGDTARIEDAQPVDPEWVADQARLVLEDMSVAAFKIGVPGSVENVAAIAEIVSDYPDVPLVLDPFGVPVRESLDQSSDDMTAAVRELLVPQTTLLVLSAGELAQLAETWREPANADMTGADVAHLIEAGCEYVLVTGMPCGVQEVATALFDDSGIVRQDVWPRVAGSFAGAGATLSGAAAAMLANGLDVPEAVSEAQEFTLAALANAQRPGMGRLLPDRFFWAREDAADDE